MPEEIELEATKIRTVKLLSHFHLARLVIKKFRWKRKKKQNEQNKRFFHFVIKHAKAYCGR